MSTPKILFQTAKKKSFLEYVRTKILKMMDEPIVCKNWKIAVLPESIELFSCNCL
jgi:hypothetical protein